MAVHFLSFLGTGNYKPVRYEGSRKTKFIQVALLERFQKELEEENARITIFSDRGGKKEKLGEWIENRDRA